MDELETQELASEIDRLLKKHHASREECMNVGAELYIFGLRAVKPDVAMMIDMVINTTEKNPVEILTLFVVDGVKQMQQKVPMIRGHAREDGSFEILQDTITKHPPEIHD